jgi:CRP/FNR family transcriptional regulator
MMSIIPRGDGVSSKVATSLSEAEFFRALTPAQLKTLQPQLSEKAIQRGKVLYFGGAPAEYLWCVRRGAVRLYKSSSNGRITTLETMNPGQIFGAVSALDRDAYPASAEGVADGVAWTLPRSHFLRLLEEEPSLTRELLQIITHRLHSAHERVRSFAHDPAPARLAQVLLRVSHDLEANVTRKDLAEAAGTTVETAIRVLRTFQRENVVQAAVGKVTIIDEPALRQIAGASEP